MRLALLCTNKHLVIAWPHVTAGIATTARQRQRDNVGKLSIKHGRPARTAPSTPRRRSRAHSRDRRRVSRIGPRLHARTRDVRDSGGSGNKNLQAVVVCVQSHGANHAVCAGGGLHVLLILEVLQTSRAAGGILVRILRPKVLQTDGKTRFISKTWNVSWSLSLHETFPNPRQ